MHIKNHQPLVDYLQTFINANSPGGGKAIIDINGEILTANDLNLVFSLENKSQLFDLFPDAKLELSPKILEQSAHSNKSIRQDVAFSDRGTDYWFWLSVSPLSTDGSPLFLAEFIDITHFKNAEKTAKTQRRRIENELLLRTKEIVQTDLFTKENGGFLTNFMRGLRHDLLSPIAQLKDIIDYYKKTEDPKKKQQSARFIDDILQKLHNTARGFSDFVDLHILPQSKMESIQIEEVLAETKNLLSEEISQTKATITEQFETAETLIFNKVIMNSIVHNLLSNAIKFRRENTAPVILIQTFQEGKYFVLLVKDNGTGIDLKKYGDKLFIPFQRLHTNRPGVGVGLSMLKNTLLRYEGDIQIKSVLGEGTTVRVSIPQMVNEVN